MESIVCHSVSHSTPFCSHIFMCKCSLPMSSGSRPWLLLYYQYWILTGIPLRYPVVGLCHGDPAALDLWEQLLRAFSHSSMGQFKSLDLGLNDIWSVLLLSCPQGPAHQQPPHQGQLYPAGWVRCKDCSFECCSQQRPVLPLS